MAVEESEPEMGSGSDPAGPARIFSLAEANALLPSLVPILTRLRDTTQSLLMLRLRLASLDLLAASDAPRVQEEREQAERERPDLARRIEALAVSIDEDVWMIRALGVELKSVDQGLVDFPTMREGRIVYLCWRLGEGPIAFWHDIEAGFRGRQPIERPGDRDHGLN
jgi:hypothetical protein